MEELLISTVLYLIHVLNCISFFVAHVLFVIRFSSYSGTTSWKGLLDIADPGQAKLVHLNSKLEQVIQTTSPLALQLYHSSTLYSPLTHGLCLSHIIAPYVNSMSADKHGIGFRVFLHGHLQELGQILLMGRILDNRDSQRIMVPKVARLLVSLSEALDLLDVVDFENRGTLALEEEGDENSPLGVGVDAATGVALGEGGEEEWGALGGFVDRWGAEVDSVLWV